MIIELKYKPSEDVWFMHENKPRQGFVDKVDIKLDRGEKTSIRYSIFSVTNTYYSDSELFQTKEALLQSL